MNSREDAAFAYVRFESKGRRFPDANRAGHLRLRHSQGWNLPGDRLGAVSHRVFSLRMARFTHHLLCFRPATITSLFAVACLDYFILQPVFSFEVNEPQNLVALAPFESYALNVSR